MCGRFTLSQSAETISQAFHIEKVPDIAPQFNIAPTQMVATVLYQPESHKRELQHLRWGLIPSWAKDLSMGAKLINARAETLAEKPAFRSAYKRRRCIVIADGFYEWQQQAAKKQPFYFRLKDGKPFGFAGLWEQWESLSGEKINSCTIVTTDANELIQAHHHRMPVILFQKDYDVWLDPSVQNLETLQGLLQPLPAEAMVGYAVSTLVNNHKHNTPECIEPLK
jgi:putative SOS response-associated peptidase YedK